jgi:ankyrin repeat protein
LVDVFFFSLRGHYDTVVALINEGAQINAVDNDRVSALMWASKSGHLDIVKKLVELQADFNMTNTLGETAQDIAVKAKKIEVAEFLSTLSDNALSAAPVRFEYMCSFFKGLYQIFTRFYLAKLSTF